MKLMDVLQNTQRGAMDMEWEEYRRRSLRNEERIAVMELDMMVRQAAHCFERLEGRLKGYKYTKRDLGMIKCTLTRVIEQALGECAPEMAEQIIRQSRDFRIGLERISPVRKMEEVVMPLEDEWQFVQIALESRCSMCLKTPGEVRACKLRKLLRKYADEPRPGSMTECGYMGHLMGDSEKLNRPERL